MSASSKFCSDHLHVIDPSQEGLGWVSVDDQTCVTDDDDNGDGTVEIEDVLPHWEYYERGWHPMSADVSRLIEQGYAVGAKKVNTYWEHNGLRHRRKFCIQQRRQVRYVFYSCYDEWVPVKTRNVRRVQALLDHQGYERSHCAKHAVVAAATVEKDATQSETKGVAVEEKIQNEMM